MALATNQAELAQGIALMSSFVPMCAGRNSSAARMAMRLRAAIENGYSCDALINSARSLKRGSIVVEQRGEHRSICVAGITVADWFSADAPPVVCALLRA